MHVDALDTWVKEYVRGLDLIDPGKFFLIWMVSHGLALRVSHRIPTLGLIEGGSVSRSQVLTLTGPTRCLTPVTSNPTGNFIMDPQRNLSPEK